MAAESAKAHRLPTLHPPKATTLYHNGRAGCGAGAPLGGARAGRAKRMPDSVACGRAFSLNVDSRSALALGTERDGTAGLDRVEERVSNPSPFAMRMRFSSPGQVGTSY